MAGLNPQNVNQVLESIYDLSVAGIPMVSKPVEEVAEEYLKKYRDKEIAAKKMLNAQISKCTVSGFLTGLGGLITLPVAVSADISVVLYAQMRMIAAAAYIGGYKLDDDEVQTFVYACLAGVSVTNIAKKTGAQIGQKLAVGVIKKIPGEVVVKINKAVGFRMITKFGEKGAINLGKLVPGVGALISGGFDFADTKIIAARAYKAFVLGDLEALGDNKQRWFEMPSCDLNPEDLEWDYSVNVYKDKCGDGKYYIECSYDEIEQIKEDYEELKEAQFKKLMPWEIKKIIPSVEE